MAMVEPVDHQTVGGSHSTVTERLSLLHGTCDDWKVKVEDKDTEQFTVIGKLSKSGQILCITIFFYFGGLESNSATVSASVSYEASKEGW